MIANTDAVRHSVVMQYKELRIALVCYGGVSLAVYMHGVTKEIWKALQASRDFWSGGEPPQGTPAIYAQLLEKLRTDHNVKLRLLTDIVAGASAGGINSVFLAQAIYSGQSLEPLTDLWLDNADIDALLDPDARPGSKTAKFWAHPIVSYLLSRPEHAVSESVAPETRQEVREKLSRLIRSRWFEPPFSGIGFSRLLHQALTSMAQTPADAPLLPPSHPIDLFVTATDFKGHLQTLKLHSPKSVLESEHRLTFDFHGKTPRKGTKTLAEIPELVMAARATASFPGAFPPLRIAEIETLLAESELEWPNKGAFLSRIMPEHARREELDCVSLIDGSVLVNAPFADAISVLRNRPATRQIDRRFVYIDPTPDHFGIEARKQSELPGFFSVIFGALSTIPREQPIRDNLETLARNSREITSLNEIISAMRPQINETVEKLFGHTLFLDRPTPKRLAAWRHKAQLSAIEQSGYAYLGYAQVKFTSIIDTLANLIHDAMPEQEGSSFEHIRTHLIAHLSSQSIDRNEAIKQSKSQTMIRFFRTYDLAFRIRRLRLLARWLVHQLESDNSFTEQDRDTARTVVYEAMALYIEREPPSVLGKEFPKLAIQFFEDPQSVIDHIAQSRNLLETDQLVDQILSQGLTALPTALRRSLLLTYLGFPFYDTATLPLLPSEGLNEFDPILVDRISPEDCSAIRKHGASSVLKGTEFFNFGAFFSRAYRENDYLWGRLHGAERVIDLIASTLPQQSPISPETLATFKRAASLRILDEEEERLTADPTLIPRIRAEIEVQFEV